MIRNLTQPQVIALQIYLKPTSVYAKIKKLILTGLKIEMLVIN